MCFPLILDLLAVLGTLLRRNGFSQTSAVSVQLLLKKEGVIHTDTYCRAASTSSYLSRTSNDCAPDGIVVLLSMPHRSLLQGMISENTFQNEGKCVSLGGLEQWQEGEDLLWAVGLAEGDVRSPTDCSTAWPWQTTGRSREPGPRGDGRIGFSPETL